MSYTEQCLKVHIMLGRYWEDEAHTKQVVRADSEDCSLRWMHTGDKGIMDENGYLRSESPCDPVVHED